MCVGFSDAGVKTKPRVCAAGVRETHKARSRGRRLQVVRRALWGLRPGAAGAAR